MLRRKGSGCSNFLSVCCRQSSNIYKIKDSLSSSRPLPWHEMMVRHGYVETNICLNILLCFRNGGVGTLSLNKACCFSLIGFDPKEPVSLLALFLFTSSRSVCLRGREVPFCWLWTPCFGCGILTRRSSRTRSSSKTDVSAQNHLQL